MSQDKEPRRRFLRQVLAIVPATTLATGATLTQSACSSDKSAAPAASTTPYEPKYFTADEWRFVNAAVDRLIPADDLGPGALQADVPQFIDRQMETPFGHGKLWYMQGPFHPDQPPEMGYQLSLVPRDIYRHGIAACDAYCKKQYNKAFADLDHATQETVLSDLEHAKVEFDSVPARTFFSYLLANTKEGFLSDPIHGGNKDMVGWKLVGFPGARADFMDWVDQPNVKYPYQMHNVRLLLLSGIGKPYDPKTGEGVVGKNYAYQMNGAVNVLLPKGTQLNPFIGTGAGGVSMDDLNGDQFDHGPLGFIGGASIRHVRYGGRPIKMTPTVPGTPSWGSKWKAGIADAYQRYMTIGISGSVMSYRDACLDLDPTYKDAYGVPLLRMTFDWHDNEYAMLGYMGDRMEEVGRAMNPEKVFRAIRKKGTHYDTRIYQSTHTTGGTIMGTNPTNSVVNRYLQSWDVSNVFVMGASAFPQNMGYNPTGVVAALAYWSAKAIREQYLKNAGPLVQA